jgi:hypothetical protein
MQKYELDLETLLSLLEEMRQNSILFANVPPGILGQKTGFQVRIDLVEGKIAYCHIEDDEGRIHVLGNQKAFSLLYGMGTLEWYVETHLPDTPLPTNTTLPLPRAMLPTNTQPLPRAMLPTNTRPLPAPSPYDTVPLPSLSSIVPRPTVYNKSLVLQRLSRSQRRVLVLVDGTKSVEKIASMLYPSSQDSIQVVLKTLRELESLGLITMAM